MKVLLASLLIIVIDQAAKLLVKGFSIPFLGLSHTGIPRGSKIPVLGDWLNISFVENPGIALGIDFGPEYKTYLTIFTFIAAAGLLVYLYRMKAHSFTLRLSLALILGGAIGNLIDRAFYGLFYGYAPFLHGKVVDFIDVRMFSLLIFNKTMGNYVLNIADIAVSLGVFLLLFSLSREKEVTPANLEEAQANNFVAENKE